MQETIVYFLVVVVGGNLALMAAIPVAGILWFAFGDYIRKER